MIVSNLHCTDSLCQIIRLHMFLLIQYAFCHANHTVSFICLHMIISSQCVCVCMHVVSCCLTMCYCVFKSLCVFASMYQHVVAAAWCYAPVPHQWWSFSWPSPLSLLPCGFGYKAGKSSGWDDINSMSISFTFIKPSTIQTVMELLSFSAHICIALGSNPE